MIIVEDVVTYTAREEMWAFVCVHALCLCLVLSMSLDQHIFLGITCFFKKTRKNKSTMTCKWI